jgi:hypothetical protein
VDVFDMLEGGNVDYITAVFTMKNTNLLTAAEKECVIS